MFSFFHALLLTLLGSGANAPASHKQAAEKRSLVPIATYGADAIQQIQGGAVTESQPKERKNYKAQIKITNKAENKSSVKAQEKLGTDSRSSVKSKSNIKEGVKMQMKREYKEKGAAGNLPAVQK